jgi:hypothetical protein
MGNMYLPLLAAELPAGWTVFEGTTFVSPSGTEVHARVHRAPDGWVATDLIEREAAVLGVEATPIGDAPSSTFRVNGNRIVAQQRGFTFRRDGIDREGRIICAIDDGMALTITASWTATNAGADGEVDEVASGIRILNRPIATFEARPHSAVRASQAGRIPPEHSAWSALRKTWATPIDAVEEIGSVARWSPQELAVFALTLNSPNFPTVGVEEFAALPQMAMQVTLETVMRSFIARGLVRALEDGSVALEDELHSLMDAAVFPDLTVLAEHIGAGGIAVTWFGVRPDRAVRVRVIPDGSRECGEIVPAHLIGHLWNLSGSDERSEEMVDGAADQQRSVTLEDFVDRRGGVVSLLRVTTAWRVGDIIHGGIVAWALGTSGELWLATQHDTPTNGALSWDLQPCDLGVVRDQLLDHLPGG